MVFCYRIAYLCRFVICMMKAHISGIARTALWARTAGRCACSCPNSSEEHMPSTVCIANRLLVALAPEDLDLLRPHLEAVPLPHKQTLSNPNTPIDHVYFVQEGMVSLVQPLENGVMIEVGMIGKEGFLGVPVLLGAGTSPLEAMVQIPGSALRMPASVFREEAGRSVALMGLLLRYVQ